MQLKLKWPKVSHEGDARQNLTVHMVVMAVSAINFAMFRDTLLAKVDSTQTLRQKHKNQEHKRSHSKRVTIKYDEQRDIPLDRQTLPIAYKSSLMIIVVFQCHPCSASTSTKHRSSITNGHSH